MSTIESNYLSKLYSAEFKDDIHDVTEKRAKSYLLYERVKVKNSYIVLPRSDINASHFTIYARTNSSSLRTLNIRVLKTDDRFSLVFETGNGRTTFSSARLLKLYLQNLDRPNPQKRPVEDKENSNLHNLLPARANVR